MTTPDTKKLQEIFNVYSGAPVVVANGVVRQNDRTLTRLWNHIQRAGFGVMTISPLAGFGAPQTCAVRTDRVNVALTQDMAGIWRVNGYNIG